MPEMMVRSLAGGFGDANSHLVAEVFGVSQEAATYRLHNLGLLKGGKRDEALADPHGERMAFLHLAAQGIPAGLSTWRMLQHVVSNLDGSHRCTRCAQPVMDEADEVCWRCGDWCRAS